MARSWYDNVVRYFQGDSKEDGDTKPKEKSSNKVRSDGTVHKPKEPAIRGKTRKEMMDEIIKRDGG